MKGRPNKLFLRNLRALFGRGTFTTKQAETLYLGRHMKDKRYLEIDGKPVLDTYWARMSARNTLTMATQRGLLTRIEKGVYTFKGHAR
jgi:predicted transcriptional regulator of viral defense system